MTMTQVTSVVPLDNFVLLVGFSTGELRRFDMTPYLEIGVFKRLKNPGLFKLARVDYGTVTWPGELDIAPETLYLESIPESNQKVA
jgi:hypothetical protein